MSRFIVFLAPPFAGHLNPQVPLALAAQSAGYRVAMLTGPAKLETLRRKGLTAETLRALSEGSLEAIADAPEKVGSNPLRLAKQMRQVFAVLRPARDELIERWRADRPDLVVADFAAVPAGLAADALGIPWVTTMRPPFVLETGHGPPSYLGGWAPMPGALGAARDAAGWALVRNVKGALAAMFAKELRDAGLTRLRADGSEAIYSPYALLSTTMAELEFTPHWPAHMRFLGPIADNPEIAPRLDLPQGRPRVLVTLGTHLPWAKHMLMDETAALAARMPDVRFVVSLGDAKRIGAAPLETREGVRIFGFAPYVAELPHFDAVIHHGGAGVVFATIAAGKPALVCPQDYDQFDYAARVAHFGLGQRIKRIGAAETAAKLRALLDTPLPALARFAEAAHAYRPAETFLDVARKVITGERIA